MDSSRPPNGGLHLRLCLSGRQRSEPGISTAQDGAGRVLNDGIGMAPQPAEWFVDPSPPDHDEVRGKLPRGVANDFSDSSGAHVNREMRSGLLLNGRHFLSGKIDEV